MESEAGFTPAVPRRATFQAPTSVAEERGGSAGGTSVPSAHLSVPAEAEWSFRPDLLRPSPCAPLSKRRQAWPRRGVRPRRGTSVPPAKLSVPAGAEWSLRPDLLRPSPRAPPSKRRQAWPRRGEGPRRGTSVPPANLRVLLLLGGRRLHVRHTHLVAAAHLRRVEGLVSALDEAGEQRRLSSRRDADADRELQTARKRVRGDLRPNAFREDARPGVVRLVQHQRKLLAAVSGADIGFPRAGAQDRGQLGEHCIAVKVAVGVVDLLEVVEVDHQESDRLVVAARSRGLLEELLRQRSPVRKLGQLVRQRVLLLRLEELRMADGDRGLRCNSDQQVALVFSQLAPRIQVELQRTHQLA